MKVRIEKPIYGGAGLARDAGKAVFVPYTLPGELVEARAVRDKGSYIEAEAELIVEPSAERALPACRYFGECGGCHYQHASYAEQVRMKTEILRETLERARVAEVPEIGVLCGEPLGYRNRIRLHIDSATSKLSYKKRASHQNLVVDVCPIAAPVLENALKALQGAAAALRLDEHFSEIELFTNAAQDAVLVSLWTSASRKLMAAALTALWAQLLSLIPQVRGAAIFSAQTGEVLAQTGDGCLRYTAAGYDYRVSLGSFFQVNRFLVDPLVELVTRDTAGEVAWDLYAGVGLFSVALGVRFAEVVAVESAPSSVRDLRENLKGDRRRAVSSTTLEFLRRARSGKQPSPDFVLVDPPRAGLGKEVTTLLAELRPRQVTYVSCDPATLSRDLKSLLDSGYHLSTLRMVDLFPQTFHLESVAMLSRQ